MTSSDNIRWMRRTAWFERTFQPILDNGLLPGILERLDGTPVRLRAMVAGATPLDAAHGWSAAFFTLAGVSALSLAVVLLVYVMAEAPSRGARSGDRYLPGRERPATMDRR